MTTLLYNPLIPTVAGLVLGLLWIAVGFIVEVTRKDLSFGHSDWPEDLTDFHKIIVVIDLPVPMIKRSIYSQLVEKYNFEPLDI